MSNIISTFRFQTKKELELTKELNRGNASYKEGEVGFLIFMKRGLKMASL